MQEDCSSPLLNNQAKAFSENQTMAARPLHNTGRKEILTITIDLGGGKSENIVVKEGDEASDLASKFSQKYGLNQRLMQLLTIQIEDNIEQVKVKTLTHHSLKHARGETENNNEIETQISIKKQEELREFQSKIKEMEYRETNLIEENTQLQHQQMLDQYYNNKLEEHERQVKEVIQNSQTDFGGEREDCSVK
jgi:hypothetical protein